MASITSPAPTADQTVPAGAPAGAAYRDPSPSPYRADSYLRNPQPSREIRIANAARYGSVLLARTGDWRIVAEHLEDVFPYDYPSRAAAMDAVARPEDNCHCTRCACTFYSPKPASMCGGCVVDKYL